MPDHDDRIRSIHGTGMAYQQIQCSNGPDCHAAALQASQSRCSDLFLQQIKHQREHIGRLRVCARAGRSAKRSFFGIHF